MSHFIKHCNGLKNSLMAKLKIINTGTCSTISLVLYPEDGATIGFLLFAFGKDVHI